MVEPASIATLMMRLRALGQSGLPLGCARASARPRRSADTHGEQLTARASFKQDNTAFQRLGDSNQTLYDDDAAVPAYWTPGPSCIPLDTTRRFGIEIAAFASRLTARRAQTIVGAGTRPASRVLLLFDEATIGRVLGAFAEEARIHWGDTCGTRDIWAVASRHNMPGKKKGAWQPKSLVDYHPAYRSETGTATGVSCAASSRGGCPPCRAGRPRAPGARHRRAGTGCADEVAERPA